MARPFYKGLTDNELRNEYHGTRNALALAGELRQAGQVITLNDNLQLIVRIARQRGLDLWATTDTTAN